MDGSSQASSGEEPALVSDGGGVGTSSQAIIMEAPRSPSLGSVVGRSSGLPPSPPLSAPPFSAEGGRARYATASRLTSLTADRFRALMAAAPPPPPTPEVLQTRETAKRLHTLTNLGFYLPKGARTTGGEEDGGTGARAGKGESGSSLSSGGGSGGSEGKGEGARKGKGEGEADDGGPFYYRTTPIESPSVSPLPSLRSLRTVQSMIGQRGSSPPPRVGESVVRSASDGGGLPARATRGLAADSPLSTRNSPLSSMVRSGSSGSDGSGGGMGAGALASDGSRSGSEAKPKRSRTPASLENVPLRRNTRAFMRPSLSVLVPGLGDGSASGGGGGGGGDSKGDLTPGPLLGGSSTARALDSGGSSASGEGGGSGRRMTTSINGDDDWYAVRPLPQVPPLSSSLASLSGKRNPILSSPPLSPSPSFTAAPNLIATPPSPPSSLASSSSTLAGSGQARPSTPVPLTSSSRRVASFLFPSAVASTSGLEEGQPLLGSRNMTLPSLPQLGTRGETMSGASGRAATRGTLRRIDTRAAAGTVPVVATDSSLLGRVQSASASSMGAFAAMVSEIAEPPPLPEGVDLYINWGTFEPSGDVLDSLDYAGLRNMRGPLPRDSEKGPKYEHLLAASLVDDARFDRTMPHGVSRSELWWYSLVQKYQVRWFFSFFVTLNMLLALAEPPTGISVPFGLVTGLELLTLAAISLRLYLYSLCDILWSSSLMRRKLHLTCLLVVIVTTVDIILHLSTGSARFTRVLRPFFVIHHSKDIRHGMRNIMATLWDIFGVVFLLFVFCAFYALCCLVFYGYSPYFSSYGVAFLSIFILSTTNNYPDVMMDPYRRHPANALFFVAFVIICSFVFTSLVLAIVYNKYRHQAVVYELRSRYIRRQRLEQAFTLMTDDRDGDEVDWMSFREWTLLFTCLRPSYSPQKVALMWHVVAAGQSEIDVDTFCDGIVDIMHLQISSRVERGDYLFQLWKDTPIHTICVGLTDLRLYKVAIGLLSVLNVAFLGLAYESSIKTSHGNSSRIFATQHEAIILAVFTLDVLAKVVAVGLVAYFKKVTHIVDSGLMVIIYVDLILHAFGFADPLLYAWLLLFRMFRIWQVIQSTNMFSIVFKSLWKLRTILATYIVLQLIVMYVYAIVGMSLFGGLITRHNPKLVGTSFAADDYYMNSMNTLYQAMITLFELMVLDDWQYIASGYVEVTSQWAWVYIISYVVIATMIVVNIVLAFIIDAFVYEWEIESSGGGDPLESLIEEEGKRPEFCVKKSGEKGFTVWSARRKQDIRFYLNRLFKAAIDAEEAKLEKAMRRKVEERMKKG